MDETLIKLLQDIFEEIYKIKKEILSLKEKIDNHKL